MSDLYRTVGAVVRLLPEERYPVWCKRHAYRVETPGIIDGALWAEGCIVWLKDDQVEAMEGSDGC